MESTVVLVTQRRSAGYLPTVWDPELIKSFSPLYKYESHCSRLEELKQSAKCWFTSLNQPAEQKLELINTMQRLGVAKHFSKEVKEVLHHVNLNTASDLYTVALQFRLLRENGFFIKPDVFNKFMDSDGKFKDNLREDVAGLLSLYEASYLGLHGEDVLEEAHTFSTKHLKSFSEKLENDLAEQVKESLQVPLYWRLPRSEARNFINIYQRDAKRNLILLELAKLDFNLLQSVYLKELHELAEWWKGLNIKEKLPFARDRLVESYFWAMGSVSEPRFYKCRRNLAKFACLTTVLDDVFDVYGSITELDAYTNAVNGWELEATEELPEYMKVCYLVMYNHVNEMVEDASKDLGLDILPYIKDQWMTYVRSLRVEAGWFYGGYMPSLDEYLRNGWTSIGLPVGLAYAFFGVLEEDSKPQNKFPSQFFQNWFDSELFYLPALITRLVDDLNTSKDEMERGEITNAIQCYMIEEGVCEEEARDHIKGLISASWKKLNKFIAHHFDHLPISFANTALAMTRCVHRIYQFGDWFGVQSKANKDCLYSSLFNPI